MTPDTPRREVQTIDLSRRSWGCNYNILRVIEGGKELRLATWCTPTPCSGDYVILTDGDRTTRYQVDRVQYASGVDDMTFLDVTFAPRARAASMESGS